MDESTMTRHYSVTIFSICVLGAIGVVACSGGADPRPDHGDSTATNQQPLTAASPNLPAGYVQTPAGLTHASCVHEIPHGSTVDADGNVQDAKGAVLARYDPCGYKPTLKFGTQVHESPAASSTTQTSSPTVNGWVSWVKQTIPSGSTTWNFLATGITVPPDPIRRTGQLLYYFNGLEPSNGNRIVQPVLQWGSSPAGGGNYWAIASWIVWGDGRAYHTGISQVNVGDYILATVNLTNATTKLVYQCKPKPPAKPVCGYVAVWQYTYVVTAYDENNGATESYTDNELATAGLYLGHSTVVDSNVPRFPFAYPAVYEAYNEKECAENPVHFDGISLYSDHGTGYSTNATNGNFVDFSPVTGSNEFGMSCFIQPIVDTGNIEAWL
jgi:hypothetical protein